jgi:hypothetical protein
MRALSRLCLLALIASTTRCDDSTDPDLIDVDFVGTYHMVSLNGSPPPVLLINEPDLQVEILDEITTLNADGTYLDITIFRETNAGVATEQRFECPGTFTRSGANFNFVDDVSNGFCGATFSGSVEGNTLILRFGPAYVSVLRR